MVTGDREKGCSPAGSAREGTCVGGRVPGLGGSVGFHCASLLLPPPPVEMSTWISS